jgi:hypothetical protein
MFRSVFDFALEQLDFFGGEVEKAIDAGVEFGFGVAEFAGLAFDGGSVFCEIGIPFVGGARVIEGVGGELETRLEGVAEFGERALPPRRCLLVECRGRVQGLGQPITVSAAAFVAERSATSNRLRRMSAHTPR